MIQSPISPQGLEFALRKNRGDMDTTAHESGLIHPSFTIRLVSS